MNSPILTEKFELALVYATRLHAHQVRKVDGTPYIAHLLSVAAMVLEAGGTETEAIAALLHDSLEDQGGAQTEAQIRLILKSPTVMDNPADLMNVAIAELVKNRYELPGFNTLNRLVRRGRNLVNQRLFSQVEM